MLPIDKLRPLVGSDASMGKNGCSPARVDGVGPLLLAQRGVDIRVFGYTSVAAAEREAWWERHETLA